MPEELEKYLDGKTHAALGCVSPGDFGKSSRRFGRARCVKGRGIGHVEHLPAELQARFLFQAEGAEEAAVEVRYAGPKQDVTAAGPEAHAGRRQEGVGVEVVLAAADGAIDLDMVL